MSQATLSRPFVLSLVVILALLSPLPLGEGSGVRSAFAAPAGISGTKIICPTGGDYTSLTTAIGTARAGVLDGPLTLELCASYNSVSRKFCCTFTGTRRDYGQGAAT
ncbi:MAG: hypothetical protein NT169_25420 [Chloroflexi bacterium]|nr:hypothetical protein [Chloroflexota bacterium]